jgi:hypothetical protein
MSRALTPRSLAMVSIPGHHEQGDMAIFEIKCKEGHCYPDSLIIEMAG